MLGFAAAPYLHNVEFHSLGCCFANIAWRILSKVNDGDDTYTRMKNGKLKRWNFFIVYIRKDVIVAQLNWLLKKARNGINLNHGLVERDQLMRIFPDYFKSVSFFLISVKKSLLLRVITERKFIAHSSSRKRREIILWYIVSRVDLANEITINHRSISLTLSFPFANLINVHHLFVIFLKLHKRKIPFRLLICCWLFNVGFL